MQGAGTAHRRASAIGRGVAGIAGIAPGTVAECGTCAAKRRLHLRCTRHPTQTRCYTAVSGSCVGLGGTEDTGDSSGTDQSIQAEVTKPSEPSSEAKTDPNQTPDGKKTTKKTDGGTPTADSSSEPSTPKAGDKNSKGQVYFPGFGWVDDEGGGTSGTTAGDMYENGNKLGNMN